MKVQVEVLEKNTIYLIKQIEIFDKNRVKEVYKSDR
jgi:hypothetical protein